MAGKVTKKKPKRRPAGVKRGTRARRPWVVSKPQIIPGTGGAGRVFYVRANGASVVVQKPKKGAAWRVDPYGRGKVIARDIKTRAEAERVAKGYLRAKRWRLLSRRRRAK